MANVAHSALTGSNLHEPKGVATAASGSVYIANGSGSGSWTISEAVAVGMVADFCTPVVPTGWLELDGSVLSAATYAALYTAMTIQQTGSRGVGSAIITGLTSTANMKAGYYVAGTGLTAGSTIVSVDSATQITISVNAGSSGTSTVLISPWVINTTQITLPNTTASGKFRRSRTSSVVMGTSQADQNQAHTHTTDSQGSHTHTVSITDPGHLHSLTTPVTFAGPGTSGGSPNNIVQAGTPTTGSSTTGITATVDSQGSHTHSITSSGGTEARPFALVLMTCVKT